MAFRPQTPASRQSKNHYLCIAKHKTVIMVPLYLFTVDILSNITEPTGDIFRECISASLSHLEALQASFGRYQLSVSYHQPGELTECDGWSARAVVSISVGRQKENGIVNLSGALVKLIQLELPDLNVSGGIDRFQF